MLLAYDWHTIGSTPCDSKRRTLAASAPVLGFDGMRAPGELFDGNAFWRVVTRDASPAAGAHPHCVPSVRAAYAAIDEYAATVAGRAMLAGIFRLCSPMVREGQGPEGEHEKVKNAERRESERERER